MFTNIYVDTLRFETYYVLMLKWLKNNKTDLDYLTATEILLQHYTSPSNTIPASQKIIFRAATLEDKAAWKSLLEQKVLRARGGHIENVGTSETFRSGIIWPSSSWPHGVFYSPKLPKMVCACGFCDVCQRWQEVKCIWTWLVKSLLNCFQG